MRGTPNTFYATQDFGVATGNVFYCSGAATRRWRLCSPKAHITGSIAQVSDMDNVLAEAKEKTAYPVGELGVPVHSA